MKGGAKGMKGKGQRGRGYIRISWCMGLLCLHWHCMLIGCRLRTYTAHWIE